MVSLPQLFLSLASSSYKRIKLLFTFAKNVTGIALAADFIANC
jgi:hypothetical protein